MAYSDFKTINQAQATFDLSINMVNLFPNIELVEPSEYLKMTLKRNLKVAFDNNTEKARFLTECSANGVNYCTFIDRNSINI